MATKLLSLYLRAGTGAARLAFRLTERMVMLAGSAIGLTDRNGSAASVKANVSPAALSFRKSRRLSVVAS